jgi:hypothetical protein
MPDQNEQQHARVRRQRERQYEIDSITAQYADDFQSGRAPRMEAYLQRYPQYESELLEFAIYFHTIGFDADALDASPAPALSAAAQRAMTQIRASHAPQTAAPATPAIQGLVKQGVKAGYPARKLAEAVGLSIDLLGKLEARVIAVATIPPTLVKRLADTLQVVPEAVSVYLGAAQPGQAGAFYYADQPPSQQQESFLDAVQASALPPERKQEWAAIVKDDAARGG